MHPPETPLCIGRTRVPLAQAAAWLRDYTDADANRVSAHPYAYPAYDTYDGMHNDPDRISDADLLAPLLLNVSVSLRSYYNLQRIRTELERALGAVPVDLALAETESEQVEAQVRALYSVLDDPRLRPSGVRATTLSKIWHRKRPAFVVLHDRWVRACYYGAGAPVAEDKTLTSSAYMVLISQAVRTDLRVQEQVFDQLFADVPGARSLSRVRVLDILAWSSQGQDSLAGAASP